METRLQETARFIHTLTQLPVTVFSGASPLASHCGPDFAPYLPQHHSWYGSREEDPQALMPFEPRYLENPLQEGYLEFGAGAGFRVLTGPFLLGRTKSQQRKRVLERLNFDLGDHRLGKPYLNALKVLQTEGMKAVQFLLYLCQRFLTETPGKEHRTESLVTDYYRNLIANRESYYHHPPFQLEKQLMEQIRAGQAVQARETANRLYTHPDARLAPAPVRSYRNSLICRCTLYTRAAIDGGVDPEAAFTLSDVMINEIEKRDTVQELFRLDLAMIGSFCELPRCACEAGAQSPLVSRAVRHIRENIYERLEVTEVAESLFVHPNYLGSRFRKEMGLPLAAYIQQQKIEESLKLLRHSDNSLCDIAAFLGFSSQSHFGSVFRRFMGVSPGKYRTAL